MDQLKIGRFIAECRKKNNLTQMQLAEKLNITDRAVSKWETGKAMPDSAIMLELCDVLDITVNDLLNGEVISLENYNRKLEEQLLEMIKQKELADKRLMKLAVFISVVTFLFYMLGLIALFCSTLEIGWYFALLLLLFFLVSLCLLVVTKLEQRAGYFQCKKCGHTYTPTFWRIFNAFAWGKKKLLRCPKCKKHTWHKKVYTKE